MLDDAAIAEAWAALEKKRRERELQGAEEGPDFSTKILGGKWTRMHKGRAYDAIVGLAAKGGPHDWCRRYGLNVEASFSLQKYGEEAASTLALQWCKVMQFFYDLYQQADDPDHVYSDAELQSFEEDLDWVNFVLAAGVDSVVWPRASLIRNLRPSARPVAGKKAGASSASSSA